MVEINLLPEELKKARRSGSKLDMSSISLENIPMLNIAIAGAGILIAAQVAVFAEMCDFPCSKQELLRMADEQEFPDEVLDVLEDLPNRQFACCRLRRDDFYRWWWRYSHAAN